MRAIATVVALLIVASVAAPQAFSQVTTGHSEASDVLTSLGLGCDKAVGAEPFVRSELFFGSNKPDGTVVTEAQFQQFLDQEITPRFPDGLTLLTGLGQFKGSNGVIQRERSMLLILLYPRGQARAASVKIEQIRGLYEQRFQQESVLRADERLPECVSF
jgi:Protein of unknown function (DUF3574)